MTQLSAAPPLEPQRYQIGHTTISLVDGARSGRNLAVDVWYPAEPSNEPLTTYEVLPGVSFAAAGAVRTPPQREGRFPLIVFSHGRTGMRHAYSLLCEALAARGAIVVSPDHPGDGLFDWAFGTAVDDRTNEVNRVDDARFVLDALLTGDGACAHWTPHIDTECVVIAGHSYGAFTGFATAAGSRGVAADTRVRAVIGLQSYTRIMSDTLLGRITVPFLLVVGDQDATTPAATDADRVFALTPKMRSWRVDLAGAAHQAASDMGLYAEMADRIDGLPQIVRDYLAVTAPDAVGPTLRPWRENVLIQVEAVWAFLDVELGVDATRGAAELARLGDTPGITITRSAPR